VTEASEKLIRSYYDAFNSKRFDEMLLLLDDSVIHDTNQGTRSIGKEAFKSFLSQMNDFYDERLDDIHVMVDRSGTRAAAEFVCHGTYKSSAEGLPVARGQKYALPVGCFFEIKSSKIARVTNYYNLEDWLAQVK
jgi:steroid delta-isomerase-like uncharacterized protein